MRISKFLLLIILLSVAVISNAQVLGWEMNGNAGNEATVPSTTTDANLAVSNLSRGAGINAASLANSFSSNGFDATSTSLADAITNNEYLEFTVTPNMGFRVSLSTLDANFRRSSTGPSDFQWQYSLDGFATAGTNAGAAINFTDVNTNGVAQAQIDLSAIAALQNVAFPNSVTFRLYGWNASSTAGTFAIGRLAGNDLAVGGTTEAITTAAGATVTGRVKNIKGRGVRFVTVMITGGDLPEPLYASTNIFGIYQFQDIPVGDSYVLTAFSGRYTFQQSSLVIKLNDNLTDVDFIALER
ncbi:MAG: carboxypeptidase-like regulatory domain-containing protein [Pyrinomonadaceae bacterium]